MGSESRIMLQNFEDNMETAPFSAKRKRFITVSRAALKTIFKKVEYAGKKHPKQRKKFYRVYYEHFLTMFLEWDRAMKKIQKEEEKLTSLFVKQWELFHQARIAQSQIMKIIKNSYDQFLKDVADLEEDQEHLVATKTKKLRWEIDQLQHKIVMDAQLLELDNIQNGLGYLRLLCL